MHLSQRIFAVIVIILYLVVAGGLVSLIYQMDPPTTNDQWKDFAVRAGLALTIVGTFVSIIVSLFTLNAQIRAAKELEARKGDILLGIENRKKEILKEIEELKGNIASHNDFLSRALDIKSVAYDKLFVATNNCYRELQNLTRGIYDKDKVMNCEQALRDAEGTAANLNDADRNIINNLIQIVFNIIDEVENLHVPPNQIMSAYNEIWEKYARSFGQAIINLQNRSPFRNRDLKIL